MNKSLSNGNTCNNKKIKEVSMRRDFRKKQNTDKILLYSIAGVVILLTIVFALIMYGNSLNNEAKQGQLSSDQIASIVKNETDAESASSSIGKSVEEAEEKQNKEKKETEEAKAQNNTSLNNNNTSLNNANNEVKTNQSTVNSKTQFINKQNTT